MTEDYNPSTDVGFSETPSERYIAARDKAKSRISELDGKPYHNRTHIRNVVEAVKRLCDSAEVPDQEREWLLLAAWFHDLGHVDGAGGHEKRSAEMAKDAVLKRGYTEIEASRVAEIIRATEMPQSPGQDKLKRLMCDADLCSLGQEWSVFKEQTLAVRDERAPEMSDGERYQEAVDAFGEHSWWTSEARELWGESWGENLERLQEITRR